MYFEIGELKSAQIKREVKAVLELNHQGCPIGIRFEVKEKVVTTGEEREIFREVASEQYSLSANVDKIIREVKDIDLKTKETLSAIITILEALGIEGIKVEEDP